MDYRVLGSRLCGDVPVALGGAKQRARLALLLLSAKRALREPIWLSGAFRPASQSHR
jgi:hypothetical protein